MTFPVLCRQAPGHTMWPNAPTNAVCPKNTSYLFLADIVSYSRESGQFSQVMVNRADDRWATESGFGTAGDAFMYLIKALLSRRRDRWRRLGYELAREISRLPQTTPFICVFPSFTYWRGCWRGCTSMRGSGGPNLLSAGNEDCAANGDPVAHVHKVGVANSLCCRSGSAVMGAGGVGGWGTLTGSIILEERQDYYSQPCLPKKEANQRKPNLAWRSASR